MPQTALSTEFGVVARSSRPGPLPYVLKDGESFAIFNSFGDLDSSENDQEGVFHSGTRYLSRMQLRVWSVRPIALGATVREDNCQLSVHLTNPDVARGDVEVIGRGAFHLRRATVLTHGSCHQQIWLVSYSDEELRVPLQIRLDVDFRDIFEVRGQTRPRRGRLLEPEWNDFIRFGYEGLDGVRRTTELHIDPKPDSFSACTARLDLVIPPRGVASVRIAANFYDQHPPRNRPLCFEDARARLIASLEHERSQTCRVHTSNEHFNRWLDRSAVDLHMLTTQLPHGAYPYAGVPWFSTPFGRDGIITALECLWAAPYLGRGVLTYLAANQADTVDAERDATPGKILHEVRQGEMAALNEVPFARYYGTVDATPLFVVLAGAYAQRTGDLEFIRSIWSNVERAVEWMERYGDLDGDGLLEFERESSHGIRNQAWKDSDDSVFDENGKTPEGPIAMVEVQAYAHHAWSAAATLAAALGHGDFAQHCQRSGERLRAVFDEAFWLPGMNTYALALDGSKRPCRVRASNAGHVLLTDLPSPQQAQALAATLMAPQSFSGWGIRTLAQGEPRYNPMSYHNGSVWPHDNALIAAGLARHGLMGPAGKLFAAMFHAANALAMSRMPELFCGFPRVPGEGPIQYPVACLPQAWAAASVFMFLQAALGLTFRAGRPDEPTVLELRHPVLPPFVQHITIRDLRMGDSSLDLDVHRHGNDVSVTVQRRVGDVTIVITK